ncbi:MAG: glycosyltransferase family 39 protein [Anaerolineae bacterium]|nr:glycosyltransferase family 39 protein [Thermoflexales bacterium]MDW8408488.1 glycosyltransferase family 39 protein [Anaerolineae bacterium]
MPKATLKIRASAHVGALLIVLVGFAARIVNLGGFDFWFDEVGQVLVGRASSPIEAIRVAADHLGATPLDYVVTWLGVQLLGENEFALRWIPLCWSTLTLALLYSAGERLERGIGNWSALLAAISPLAVRYAQEVRFYSLALMLCALTLWLSLRWRRRGAGWTVGVALVMTLSLYTHAYTALTWPFIAWAIVCTAPGRSKQLILKFGLAVALAITIFAPWLLGELLTEQVPPFADAAGFNFETARRILAGWEMPNLSPVSARNTASQPLPYLIIALHVAALLLAVYQARSSPLWIGALGIYALATLTVVLNDMRTGYFFAPRQILNLLLLRALFGGWVLRQAAATFQRRHEWSAALLAASIFVIAIPSLASYYANWRYKSNASEIAELVARVNPTAHWIVPGYDQLTVNYYLERAGHTPVSWRTFAGEKIDPETIRLSVSGGAATIVVLQATYATPQALDILKTTGFEVIWPADGVTGNEHFVAPGRR